ncbi:MAG TPA: hypothetical protein PLF44_01765 [Candidatus Mcinerneyibacteriales bacterium]|nr:hypothetical protein [Candidatus Mcinerneyibacteriales bacterium]HPJ69588.1 hypothetical protein [Candidatus Mcinerneyibacteriales bacterium]
MKKKISGVALTLILLILLTIGAYYLFNRRSASDFFPQDTVAFAKVRSFKSFLKLDSPLVDRYAGEFKKKKWIRWLPDKDFYLAMDQDKNTYIFIELSFLAPLFSSLGPVEGNVLCITTNKDYVMTGGYIGSHREETGKLKGRGDARFVLKRPEMFLKEEELGETLWGEVDVLSRHNALKISYHMKNPIGEAAQHTRAEKCLALVPSDSDFLLKVNMADFEAHYARIRKMFQRSAPFQKFLETRRRIYEKTGIDIEKQIMPLLEAGAVIGARDVDDYFAVMEKEAGLKEMGRIAGELEKRYPVEFREDDFDGLRAWTVDVTGIAGLIVKNLFKEKWEEMKKPFYYARWDFLLFFDSLHSLKVYNRGLETGILPSSRAGDFVRGLIYRSSHISLYMDSLYLNEVYKNEGVYANFSRLFFSADFNRDTIDGEVVIKLKRNSQLEEDL